MNHSRVPEEEIIPRGREIYERSVRPELGPEDEGKFVVIDVIGGTYAVGGDEEEAFTRVSERAEPDTLFFFARVGKHGAQAPAHRIGALL
jgi:hypothetical protein